MTNTPHYNIQLPTNFGSQNIWGTILNSGLGTIDTQIWNASMGTTIGINSQSSGSNITLTNPVNNVNTITLTTTGKNLILPAMNASDSLVLGGSVYVNNNGSNAFSIVAQDGSTSVISSLLAGQTAKITLLTNATANGTFLVSIPLNGLNNLSDVASANTSLNNLLPSQTSNSGKFLTTNGTNSSWASIPQSVLTGSVIMWTTNTAPSGYLECDGSAVSRTTYSALFAIIGTTWGSGDGVTTFNIPDMRGYFPRGWSHGSSIDSGRSFASTQTAAFASHTHVADVTDPGHYHNLPANVPALLGSGDRNPASGSNTFITTTNTATTGITVTNENTGGTETRPVNVAIMFIIKT